MEHLDVPRVLGMLVVMLVTAKLCGALAQRAGQAAVLGELVAGAVIGPSVLGWVAPGAEALEILSEIGVLMLMLAIGLEIDLGRLLRVGFASTAVALAGVALPFALGFAVCRMMGLDTRVSTFAGAALTATSVGITARVLSDLGRLQSPEGQIILGAAVLDDVVGLIILGVVAGLARGGEVTAWGVAGTSAAAFGFLAVALAAGCVVVPRYLALASRLELPGTVTLAGVLLAFALAWAAHGAGSAMIIGAFAAGVLLGRTPQAREVEHGVTSLGHFFVPLFFVSVGAAVDVRALNPLNAGNHRTLVLGGLLIVAAVLGKLAAGYAPFWFRGRKAVIGVGMIPRGEVGLIFARIGLSSGVLTEGLFGAITLMVMATTFLAPPLLRHLLPPPPPEVPPEGPEGIEDLVTVP